MIELMTHVQTTRFGRIEVRADQLVTFPEGLIGLEGADYALLPGTGPFRWLQSLGSPELALPVTAPERFFADFALEFDDAEVARLGIDRDAIAEVLVTVRAVAVASECTANTRAPILVLEGGPDAPRPAFQVLNRAAAAQLRAPLFGGG